MSESAESPRVLAQRYRLIEPLGRGGMGAVWKAEHLALRTPIAVKLMDAAIATNPAALLRFFREAQAAASLRSPHVVQVLDYGVDGDTPFIVMELLEGESLAARLAKLRRLSPAATADIFVQIARAMSRAHEAKIVHRDLKPDNVFLVRNEEEEVAKVLDFGIAKAHLEGAEVPTHGMTQTGTILGTPFYMSPEQAEGLSGVDFHTDIWSFGVMAYECLLGSRPFTAPTAAGIILAICARAAPVPSHVGLVPQGFDEWFARACARDPKDRFASAKEAAAELRMVCTGGERPQVADAENAPPDLAPPTATSVSPVLVATATSAAQASAPTDSPLTSTRGSSERRGRNGALAAAIVGIVISAGGAAFVLSGSRTSLDTTAATNASSTTGSLSPLASSTPGSPSEVAPGALASPRAAQAAPASSPSTGEPSVAPVPAVSSAPSASAVAVVPSPNAVAHRASSTKKPSSAKLAASSAPSAIQRPPAAKPDIDLGI